MLKGAILPSIVRLGLFYGSCCAIPRCRVDRALDTSDEPSLGRRQVNTRLPLLLCPPKKKQLLC